MFKWYKNWRRKIARRLWRRGHITRFAMMMMSNRGLMGFLAQKWVQFRDRKLIRRVADKVRKAGKGSWHKNQPTGLSLVIPVYEDDDYDPFEYIPMEDN